MKTLLWLFLLSLPQYLFAQPVVELGDSAIVARVQTSHSSDMTCDYSSFTLYFNSPEFGKALPDSAMYDFNIYFKPTSLGPRFDTCLVKAICIENAPPGDFKFHTERIPIHVIAVEDKAVDRRQSTPVSMWVEGSSLLLEVESSDDIRLEVFNEIGQRVTVLARGRIAPGIYMYPLDLEPGAYFIRKSDRSNIQTLKAILPAK